MAHHARVDGVLVEPIGHLWAAYSPASRETILLNDESAAMLEILEAGPATTAEICETLASDSGLAAETLLDTVESSWPRLVEAGLVRKVNDAPPLCA